MSDASVRTTVELLTDPAAFLAAAEPVLAADPVVATVVASVTRRAVEAAERGEPWTGTGRPCWWALVREDGAVVSAAMRTAPLAPWPLFVLPMSEVAARALAGLLLERGEEVRAANGALPATRVLCEVLAAGGGGEVRVHEQTRLFELRELVAPRSPVGLLWVWEDAEGRVVHLTGHNAPAHGVLRIGPVYTPAPHRGHGYAAAAVAAVAARALDHGHRPCLFTDRANPVSNHVYTALGFEPVVDMANLLVEPDRGPDPVPAAGGDPTGATS
ncbi:GNAT family N-acetyltransferase [Nocardioides kribbensis]|uniref:GNAT family N-acetyltransferase n=1 Tax=Nocardioides kribbensis TaxID=305517 RepID=A0ABV1NZR0_9ACTN